MTAAWLLGVALALAPALLAPPAAWAQAPKREGAADIGDKQRDLQQTQKQLKEERQKAADAPNRYSRFCPVHFSWRGIADSEASPVPPMTPCT